MTKLQELVRFGEVNDAGFVVVVNDVEIAMVLTDLGIIGAMVPRPPGNRISAMIDEDGWLWQITYHSMDGDSGYVACGIDTSKFPGGRDTAFDFLTASLYATGVPTCAPYFVEVIDRSAAEKEAVNG